MIGWQRRLVCFLLPYTTIIYASWLVTINLLPYFYPGSYVASCNPLTTSYAAFPRRNCTHMVEIPVPFNPEGKKLVRSILELVASVPEARLEEQLSLLFLIKVGSYNR